MASHTVGHAGSAAYALAERTQHQYYIQQVLILTASTVSFMLGMVALYCFLRIKRNFRHHLVLLLILSNMVKTLGYFIYPVVQLSHARIPTGLCTGNGFILAFGIEATDCIILMIAVHTLLTVFKPGAVIDKTGLYCHRRLVYICVLAYPSLMASFAFLDGKNAYTLIGPLCYLPTRPIWYRLALSWVPRYVILITITIIYAVIYFYVRFKFADFEATASVHGNSILGADNSTDSHRMSSRASFNMLACDAPRELPTSMDQSTLKDIDDQSPGLPPSIYKDANLPIREKHKAIKRQLRLLFLYPLVYLLMWIPNFVNHCWLYKAQSKPPFILNSIAFTSVGAQGAVEAIVFLLGEKPWRFFQEPAKEGAPMRERIFGLRKHSVGMEVAPVRRRSRRNTGESVQHRGTDWWEHRRADGDRIESSSDLIP